MPPPMSADLLLSHAQGLRKIARALVADEHAAEDVLQETWMAALRNPPEPRPDSRRGARDSAARKGSGARTRSSGASSDGPAEGIGAWLNGVVRRVALQRRRGDHRRRDREQRVARTEPIASVDEELARREVLRHVVEAVLSLEEPYQTVVVLRYYEDLPPREIAERLGSPVATVKSQLHRAREKLRDRLDGAAGERGAWAFALVAVFGWERALPAAAVAGGSGAWLGGLAMEWKLALVAAGIAATAIGVNELHASGALADLLPGGGEARAVASTGGGREDVAALQEPEAAAPATGGRVAVESGRTPDRLLEGPVPPAYAYELEFELLDAQDVPVEGMRVEAAPLGHPFTYWGDTDADGSFRMSWRGHTPSQELAIRIGMGVRAQRWIVDCTAGTTVRRRFASRLRRHNVFVEFSADSESPTELVQGVIVRDETEVEFENVRELIGVGGGRGDGAPRTAKFGPDSEAQFRWPVGRATELAVGKPAVPVRAHLERISIESPPGEEFELIEESFGLSDARVDVRGTVRDANGDPVPGALLMVMGSDYAYSATAGPDGSYELSLAPGKRYELRAGGGDHGLAFGVQDLRELDGGAQTTWDPLLDRGHELRGRLVDSEGAALARWQVGYVRDGSTEPWHDMATTDAEGRFSIPNLPDLAGALHACAPGGQGLVTHAFPDTRPGAGEVALVVPAEELEFGSVSVRVDTARDEDDAQIDVTLWQELGGGGVVLEWDDALQAYALEKVPAGRYRVVAGSASTGFATSDLVVVPGETAALDALALPALATVVVKPIAPEGYDSPLAAALLRRTEVDSVAATGPVEVPIRAELPPGDYVAFASSGDFGTPAFPFTVRAGEPAEHVFDLRDLRPVDVELVAGEAAEGDATWSLEILDAERQTVLADLEAPVGAARGFLPVGSYAVRVRAETGALEEVSFVVDDRGARVRVTAP